MWGGEVIRSLNEEDVNGRMIQDTKSRDRVIASIRQSCFVFCRTVYNILLDKADLFIKRYSMAVSTLNMAPYFTGYPFQGKFFN